MEMKELLEIIGHAEAGEISDILDAAIQRYQMLFPDWDINFVALPRQDEKQRRDHLAKLLAFGKKYGKM